MLYIRAQELIHLISRILHTSDKYFPISPTPRPLETTTLFSVSVTLALLAFICEVIQYLSLSDLLLSKVHLYCCKWQNFSFSWLSNIPLFIHSSMNGYLSVSISCLF